MRGMPESIKMTTAMLMHGFMMKTGACPQPGDIKNMVNAAVEAYRQQIEREVEIDRMETTHSARSEAEMTARFVKANDVIKACMASHPPESMKYQARIQGVIDNQHCDACRKLVEEALR